LVNSTVSRNRVSGGDHSNTGAGIHNTGTLTVVQSTIADNAASGGMGNVGGGIDNQGAATVLLSTISGNQASQGLGSPGSGGGIYGSQVSMQGTIVAGNSAARGPDFDGQLAVTGYNLIGNSSLGGGFGATDLLDVDPQLGPLANNGGPTQTMALSCGSPAIDASDPNFQGPPYRDQRGAGYARVVNGVADIGAYEVQSGDCNGTALWSGGATSALLEGVALVLATAPSPAPPSSVRFASPVVTVERSAPEIAALDRLFAPPQTADVGPAWSEPMHHAATKADAGVLDVFGNELAALGFSVWHGQPALARGPQGS
jgi:hypothetical protein